MIGLMMDRPTDLTEETYRRVRRRLRQAREEAGLTQEQLAGKLGMTGSGYNQWETGSRRISIGDLVRVAEILGKPVEYFLEPEPPPSAEEEAELAMYRQLDRDPYISPDVREILKRIVREEHQRWKEKQQKKKQEGA